MYHIDSKILPNNFCYVKRKIKREIVRNVRSKLFLNDFIPQVKELRIDIQIQCLKGNKIKNSLNKIGLAHPENYKTFYISH